jgi:hypothetical protein
LTSVAFETIDDWTESSKDPAAIQGPLIFRSVANYLFGNFEKAATEAEAALLYSKEHKLDPKIALGNRAYLLTEFFLQRRHKLEKPQLDQIITELKELVPQLEAMDDDPSSLDTCGAVAIAIGESEEEVRAGLKLCQLALEKTPETDPMIKVRKAYYSLHEQRAFQRLLAFGEN